MSFFCQSHSYVYCSRLERHAVFAYRGFMFACQSSVWPSALPRHWSFHTHTPGPLLLESLSTSHAHQWLMCTDNFFIWIQIHRHFTSCAPPQAICLELRLRHFLQRTALFHSPTRLRRLEQYVHVFVTLFHILMNILLHISKTYLLFLYTIYS